MKINIPVQFTGTGHRLEAYAALVGCFFWKSPERNLHTRRKGAFPQNRVFGDLSEFACFMFKDCLESKYQSSPTLIKSHL